MTGIEQEFHKVRVRFQAIGAGLLRTGWVQSLKEKHLIVSTLKCDTYKAGDRFHFELFGGDRNASFDALLDSPHPYWASPEAPLEGEEAWYQFTISSDVRFTAPKEDYRKSVPSVPARIILENEELVGKIVDVSRNGVGVLLDRKMRIGDRVNIEITSDSGSLMVVGGSVRYSRSYRRDMPFYRTGVRLTSLDAQEQKRWDDLLNAA